MLRGSQQTVVAPDERTCADDVWPQARFILSSDLVDGAALVSVANPISTFVVSERTGNVQINPQFGLLLGRIRVT